METASKMRVLLLLLLLISLKDSVSTSDENSSKPEIHLELESEQRKSDESDGSSTKPAEWSQWSSCSRSCDGGVSKQLRVCQSSHCRGDHVRYKICNMQSCPTFRDFRDDQCSAFNNIPYEGSILQWSGHFDERNPCVLTCKGRQPSNRNILKDESEFVIAQLAKKVQDGTRCRPGSLDMCINGKCESVGCNLKIGSALQVDACGKCGGDGSTCSQPLYHWYMKFSSACSVSCGGGYRMSQPVCQSAVSGLEVEENLCNSLQKPDTNVVECNSHQCPPKWHTGEWGQCSVSCGGGSRVRQVFCAEDSNHSSKIKVNESRCSGRKPRFQEPCNQMICPKWYTQSWSGCSVSCGEGTQVRVVECQNSDNVPSALCSIDTKPINSKLCVTGIQCPKLENFETSGELLPGLYHTQALVQPYPPVPPAHAESLIAEQVVPSESTFIPDEWGPCSVSCGEGIKKREVHCKIFLEFSRTIAKLPDKQCNGPKPLEFEKCVMEPCSAERIDIKDDPYRLETPIRVGSGSTGTTFSWQEQGYTHCSASCLGGVQELIVNCIRDDTQKVASPYMCARELKPEVLIRTCNDHPCPPRWNYSDFQPCTQSCGIGIQTREVTCIHEVTQGGGNTVVVPSNMCPQPPPPDRQYCNVLDCPVRWRLSDWSKCSKSCGGGEKIRKVDCKQIMAQNHTVDRPIAMCPSPKPAEKKPCNTKSCVLETDKPQIDLSNSTFIQHDPKKKKVSLKVGGAATVFYGSMIKIKCPVKRFNRTRIQWVKDQNYLPKNKKYKVSKKGALRILNLMYRDSGVYTCIAGKSTADLVLSVKPRPGEFPTSEEIQRQAGFKNSDRADFEIADVQPEREDLNHVFGNDDHSHEQRPELPRKPPTQRTRIILPTAPPHKMSNLNTNNLNGISPQSTLLTDDQTFSNSRGHRMVAVYSDSQHLEDFLPQRLETTTLSSDDEQGTVVILGKGTPDNVKFEWITTEWSKCSQSCGGNGFQMRTVVCMVKLPNATQEIETNFCEDANLELPETIRKCGMEDCPKWNVSEWIPCDKSKCIALNTAIQRREVSCTSNEDAKVDLYQCDENSKPLQKQECFREQCKGRWKVGAWSKCSANCGGEGVRYRILQCVWYGTNRPAGTACKDESRPPVMKSCKSPPCPIVKSIECRDHSLFCENVKSMNLCRITKYHQQCCHTCKKSDVTIK